MGSFINSLDKYKRNNYLYLLLLLPFLEPQIFKTQGYEFMDQLYAGLKMISAFLIVIVYGYKFKAKISLFVGLMVTLQTVIMISTIVNDGSLVRFAGPAITAIVILMLGKLINKGKWIQFMLILRNLLLILVVLNVSEQVFRVFFLGEDNIVTFLGIENRWLYFYLPLVFINMVISQIKNYHLDVLSKLIFAMLFLSLLLARSMGAVLAMTSFALTFIVLKYFKPNVVLCYLLYCVFNYLLVNGYVLKSFNFLISDILQKDITLSGRTYLWQTVIEVLEENPLTGMGVQTSLFDCSFFFERSGYVIGCFVNHPHNYFLNVAYHGGIIALLLFILLYYFVMVKLGSISDVGLKRIVFSTFAAFFVASLVDTLDFALFYLFIPMVSQMSNLKFHQDDIFGAY